MDNLLKYKIIIITENNIEFYGEIKKDTDITHSICLAEYIQKYFKEHPMLGKLTSQINADSLAYALTYFENMAILLNTTKLDEKGVPKYGKVACLELPSKISDNLANQILSLKELFNEFNDFFIEKSIVENNYLMGKIIEVDNNLNIEEKLIDAINKINGEKILKR